MKFPYALVADVHCHSWSQFSRVDPDGVNNRLRMILNELVRAAQTVKAAGGDTLVVAGDLFHVRGRIEPSVFNPTKDTFKHIAEDLGINLLIEPGNHDLEDVRADRIGNAMQSLEEIPGVTVIIEPTEVGETVMVPWIERLDELTKVCKSHAKKDRDLIIHAPLNGVIKGIPDLGLDPEEVAKWGYDRVFVGHYHNHKQFVAGKVFSIGAVTHQTWSDPGTLAGFLMVHQDRVEHHETEAPKFVNVDDVSEITLGHVCGNYVRLRLKDADDATLNRAKAELDRCEALDWVDHSSRKRPTIRTSNRGTNNVTLEQSLAGYVLNHQDTGNLDKKKVIAGALGVLTKARSLGDD